MSKNYQVIAHLSGDDWEETLTEEVENMMEDLFYDIQASRADVTYEDNNVTVVTVTHYSDLYGEIQVASAARRNPIDKRNAMLGRELAKARAMKKLANTLEKRTNGLVKHFEDVANMNLNRKPRDQYMTLQEYNESYQTEKMLIHQDEKKIDA